MPNPHVFTGDPNLSGINNNKPQIIFYNIYSVEFPSCYNLSKLSNYKVSLNSKIKWRNWRIYLDDFAPRLFK